MADYYGVNATKAIDPTPSNITDPGLLGGKVKAQVDTYEAAAVAAGKTIQMGRALPVGATVVGMVLAFDDLSEAGATLDVGDADDADRYFAAVDVATAAAVAQVEDMAIGGIGYTILGEGLIGGSSADDTTILLTVGVAAITGTIKLITLYVTE